jgi:DNA-binding response OmpR family regulator
MNNRILLLEDDPNLSKSLIKYLNINGFYVDWAKNGEEAIDLTYKNGYDLYLFDINVPLISGIDLLKELRDAEDFTPTIIVSALVDIDSITDGFIAGADDYVKKPFDPEELLVRIKAKTSSLKDRLKFRDFEIDLKSKDIFQGRDKIKMGDVQKRLLISLIKSYPNPATQGELLEQLDRPSNLALRVNISKLKKSLKLNIKNIRGVGYKII